LRVESRRCTPSDDCEPLDCGCVNPEESLWISVADASGRRVARMHLWAAYNRVQIVPVDLVDGPGDELVIFRIPNHSSPPMGWDLKIWKIGATKPIVLGGLERVAELLNSTPIGWGRWRTFLAVDAAEAKPRTIRLNTEFAATGCCRVHPSGRQQVAQLRRSEKLRFDVGRRRYR